MIASARKLLCHTLGSVFFLLIIIFLDGLTVDSQTEQAHGIKCYNCHSAGCQDPFTPVGTASLEVECTPDLARRGLSSLKDALSGLASNFGISTPNIETGDLRVVCAKVDSKDSDTDKPKVTRSCALHSDKAEFCEAAKKTVGEGSFVGCSICESDLCNGGTVTHISIGLMTATAVILMSLLH